MTQSWSTAGVDLFIEPGRTRRRASLEQGLRDAIQSRRLAPGTRLPSTRGLAEDLGLSRGTVAAAYEQLCAEGYLEAHPGAGTSSPISGRSCRPRTRPLDRSRGPVGTLRPGTPDVTGFPLATWLRATRTALDRAPSEAFGYGTAHGRPSCARSSPATWVAPAASSPTPTRSSSPPGPPRR